MEILTPAVMRFSKGNSEALKYAINGKNVSGSACTLNSTTPCLARIAAGTDRAGSAVAARALPITQTMDRYTRTRLRWRGRGRAGRISALLNCRKTKDQTRNPGLSFCR